jgi:ABC-type sugar transport system substrate-binding protein
MRKYLLPFIILVFYFLFIFTGCSKSSPTTTTSETLIPSETIVVDMPAETTIVDMPAEPTIMPTPTVIPSLPCTIAFDTDRDGNQEIYRMAPDGSQVVNLTNNPAYDLEPAWSPDGSQIVFVSNRPQKQQEGGNYLYIMNADGSNVRQLTFENESARPDWSHDGSQITYSNKGDIYIIKADGSGQSVNLTNSPERDEQPTWSPDGSQIAWLSGNDGKLNIFVMNADGGHMQQLTNNGEAFNVTWTIDGELFSNWRHPDGICFNCVMSADGFNARDAGGKGELQRFMPFRTLDGDRVECGNLDINTGNEEIYLVGEIYPDIFLNLTNNPGNDRNPDWPANCLAGFKGVALEETAAPETAPTNPPNELVFGYAGDDPAQWQRKNNFQKACDELDIQCVYGEIPELLNKKVSAIVLNSDPENNQAAASTIISAKEKGVPVFVLDAEMDEAGVYSVMADPAEMISITLKNLFKDSGESGDFAFFDFDPAQKDTAIIRDILEKEYPKIKVVTTDTKRYNFKEDEYIFNDLTVAYPALKAVWTNSGYTNAVFGIVKNISSSENYPMINCEPSKTGFYIWKDRTTEYPGFECVIVSNPPGIAYDAVYAAYYLVSGEKIDDSTLEGQYGNAFVVDFPVITNENLAKWMDIINYEKDDFVADQLMTPNEIKEKWFAYKK